MCLPHSPLVLPLPWSRTARTDSNRRNLSGSEFSSWFSHSRHTSVPSGAITLPDHVVVPVSLAQAGADGGDRRAYQEAEGEARAIRRGLWRRSRYRRGSGGSGKVEHRLGEFLR